MVAALKEKDVSDTKIRILPSNTQNKWKTLASYLELEIDSILALIPPEELSASSSGQPRASKIDEINNSPVSSNDNTMACQRMNEKKKNCALDKYHAIYALRIAGECQRTRLFLVSHSLKKCYGKSEKEKQRLFSELRHSLLELPLSFGGLLGIQGQIYISQPALRQNQIYLKNLARYKECQEECPKQVS